jgi:hypothetical protein
MTTRRDWDDEVRRLLRLLVTGKWPSGMEVGPAERKVIEANLERVRRQVTP